MKIYLAVLTLGVSGCTVVDPGNRGVLVTLGDVEQTSYAAGVVWHKPFIATVHEVSVRQSTGSMKAECYSSDLQQVVAGLDVMYRIPEGNVVKIFQNYAGNPFDTLIAPRVQEAFKEVTSARSAEAIVKERESIKQKALDLVRVKIGDLIVIEDIIIANLDLSDDLERAIEAKMVQQQEASKAEFTKQKAQVEAETALIKAQGEANAISVRGKAIRENSGIVELMIAEKWNGVSPLVVGAGNNHSIILPLDKR